MDIYAILRAVSVFLLLFPLSSSGCALVLRQPHISARSLLVQYLVSMIWRKNICTQMKQFYLSL